MKRNFWVVVTTVILLSSCAKDNVPLTGINLSLKAVYVKTGESIDVLAAADPINATSASFTWTSRNENIATVDNKGKITGVQFGNTWVVVSNSDNLISDSCEVFVNGTSAGLTGADSLSLGAGYAYDVYYSMKNGVVATVSRTNWDLGFMTGARTSTIIINSGSGVKLYTYPSGDTTAWATVNISGISGWKAMYNSDTTWSLGAFERNALGHPDYGWGVYNSINHDVRGDSIYILQLPDQSYRKIWIKKKYSVENEYIFKIASVDGTGEITDTVDCKPYTSRNFVYYSVTGAKTVDREPAADSWDFVATKYTAMIPDGSGVFVPYTVTGILTNSGVRSARVNGAPLNTTDYSSAVFQTNISVIGSDWKSFDMNTYKYTVSTDRVYFVKDLTSTVWRLVFKSFGGSSTGIIGFEKAKLN
ncbi:MAG: Ig-like domain-containing protein [Bacteroidales bacterium]